MNYYKHEPHKRMNPETKNRAFSSLPKQKLVGAAIVFSLEPNHAKEGEKKDRDARIRSVMSGLAQRMPNGCLIWHGSFDKDGRPIRILHGQQVNVRSVIFRILNPGNNNRAVFNHCGDYRCIAAECAGFTRRASTIQEKLAGHTETDSGCHVFPTRINHGEKIAKLRHDGKTLIARRESYRLFYGEIPEGWQVRNICTNLSCFNPHHLRGVPPASERLFRESRKRGN